jgi:AcrR family transcriptional regulator
MATRHGPTGGPSNLPAAVEPEEAEMIWLRAEPSTRRSAHTRSEIAAVALEIADEEGFEALSMRRVARALGAGTMTLYNYVRTKDELITLMADAVMAEVLVPWDELAAGNWRDGMRQIALRARATFRRHHWALDRLDNGQPVPNGLRVFEQWLRACSGLEISMDEKVEMISLVDEYVLGFALREAREIEDQRRGWSPEVLRFLQQQLESEELPEFRNFIGEDVEAGIERAGELVLGEGRFERGLERLLDGIEADPRFQRKKP